MDGITNKMKKQKNKYLYIPSNCKEYLTLWNVNTQHKLGKNEEIQLVLPIKAKIHPGTEPS